MTSRSTLSVHVGVLTSLVCLLLIKLAAGCPTACSCAEKGRVTCSRAGYNNIPDDIPSGTTHLDLTWNYIRSIPANAFAHLGSIRELLLDNNQIDTIEPNAFRGLENLETLTIRHNRISTLRSHSFSEINGNSASCDDKTCVIDLSGNNLKRIEENAFAWTKRMAVVVADGRGELTIDPYAFYGMQYVPKIVIADHSALNIKRGALTNVENIGIVEIRNTRLSNLSEYTFEGLRSLRGLFLDNCDIESMSSYTFSGIHYLTPSERNGVLQNESQVSKKISNYSGTFQLSNSNVPAIPADAFRDTNIAEVIMTSNDIGQVSAYAFRGLPQLNSLTLRFNSLEKLSANSMSLLRNVQEIKIHGNNISFIETNAFQDSANIGRLELALQPSHNLTIHRKAFGSLEDVKRLVIRGFSNLVIKPDAFLGLLDVSTMEISHVNLPVVRKHTFRGLMKVKRLHLMYCNISSIESNAFEGAIESIDLSRGNQLPCDCKTGKTLKEFENTFSLYLVRCKPKKSNMTKFALQKGTVVASDLPLCESQYKVTSSKGVALESFSLSLSLILTFITRPFIR